MCDGNRVRCVIGQRCQPRGHALNQVDDRLTAVRRLNRIGQPHVQVGGRDILQRTATPSSAIQIGQSGLGDRPQTQQLRGLPSPPLGCGELACTAFDFEASRRLWVEQRMRL